jgi:hypothetical protein
MIACVDLFHSTALLRGRCELDAAACASNDASGDSLDFCAWTPAEARQVAEQACGWLGACEAPLGQNAFGPCMVAALMAYDCSISPNHRVKGATHELWACLAQLADAGSCDAVRHCVLPGGGQCEAGEFSECVPSGGGASTIRVECSDGAAHVENCALWGQACQTQGAVGAVCGIGTLGDGGLSCLPQTPLGSCSGTPRSQLAWCAPDGGLVGVDCASSGAGYCALFPPGAKTWLACVAESDAGADAGCAASLASTCANGVATSCPSQVPETIDCRSLLGSDAACQAGRLEPPFDWTSPCVQSPASCTMDHCDDAGAVLVSCARGAPFMLNCASAGLNQCQIAGARDGSPQRAVCTPP